MVFIAVILIATTVSITEITNAARKSYNEKNYKAAAKYVDECLSIARSEGKKMQERIILEGGPKDVSEQRKLWALNYAGECLLLKAYIETASGDKEAAIKAYRQIMSEFPSSTFADGCTFFIADTAKEKLKELTNETDVLSPVVPEKERAREAQTR